MKLESILIILGVICLVAGITMDAINLIPDWALTIFAVTAILFLAAAFVLEAFTKELFKTKKFKKNPPADEKDEKTEGTEI